MKILKTFIQLVVLIPNFLIGGQSIVLPEIMQPSDLIVDGNHLYILDKDYSISMYNIPSFKLVKKFGKRGEGPGEFPARVYQIRSTSQGLMISGYLLKS